MLQVNLGFTSLYYIIIPGNHTILRFLWVTMSVVPSTDYKNDQRKGFLSPTKRYKYWTERVANVKHEISTRNDFHRNRVKGIIKKTQI
jgi:hypothetical protein